MSIATAASWLVGCLGNQRLSFMRRHLRSDGPFWCFSAGALLTVIVVGWLVPETKGRSLEQITKLCATDKSTTAAWRRYNVPAVRKWPWSHPGCIIPVHWPVCIFAHDND
ncbi:MAG: MFS transporter [Candidatus Acidiferrales bacterium]